MLIRRTVVRAQSSMNSRSNTHETNYFCRQLDLRTGSSPKTRHIVHHGCSMIHNSFASCRYVPGCKSTRRLHTYNWVKPMTAMYSSAYEKLGEKECCARFMRKNTQLRACPLVNHVKQINHSSAVCYSKRVTHDIYLLFSLKTDHLIYQPHPFS